MTSARKRYSNAMNARRCTGPRTAAGKARAARNALRHGLNVPVHADRGLAPEIAALAREIIASERCDAGDPHQFALACRIVETQAHLVRVQEAKLPLFAKLEDAPEVVIEPEVLIELVRLDGYERRALSRRNRAIRALRTACRLAHGLPEFRRPRRRRSVMRRLP